MYIIISLISGIILSLAFPRPNLHWVAWFALSPLMYMVCRLRLRQAALCGLAFGFGFFGVLLYWIGVFGYLPWFALAMFQAVFVVIFAMLAGILSRGSSRPLRLLLLPSLWVAVEWFRSLGMMGLTWGDVGYSQYRFLPVAQLSSVAGVCGVSFLLALSNAAIADLAGAHPARAKREPGLRGTAMYLCADPKCRPAFLCLALTPLACLFGLAQLRHAVPSDAPELHVAVVQGNIDQGTVEDYQYIQRTWATYEPMTRSAGMGGADLVVWPETVVPGCLGREQWTQDRLNALASDSHARLLVGGWDENGHGDVYNSAFLIAPGRGIVGRYAKVHLVPFGEFVPVRRWLPFLERYKVTSHDTASGPGYDAIDAGRFRIGTAICFESIFPEVSRTMTLDGAEMLCVITNDCWYDRTAAAEQHMAMSVFRAIENGRYVIRGASTGISCIIDPRGRVAARMGTRQSGVLRGLVRPITVLTLYTRLGDWVVWVSMLLSAGLPVLTAITRRRVREGAREEQRS